MKTKMYWASVRNKETNQIEIIKRDDYSSKKDFAHDLRVNGYAVRFISTPDKFDEDCENYYWECEKRKNIRKCVSESKKRTETTETVETEEKTEEEIITMANTNTNANIAKAEEQKTQFDFYNVTIGFEVEKFIGTIPDDYESFGIYSDYEKAVQAAQAAADEYGAENIYFHTVEIATRNDRDIYDREDYEFFAEERETIRYNWYTLTIGDTGKREHVNLNNPVRISFTESISDYNVTATALYYEGWRAEDEDELISEYNLTAEEAKKICDILKTYE